MLKAAAILRGKLIHARLARHQVEPVSLDSAQHAPVLSRSGQLVRSFHASPSAAGARHTTTVPDRVKHWREHISKKALKRYRRRREQKQEQAAAVRNNALALRQDSLTLPPAEVLAERSRSNRVILESLLAPPSVPVRPSEALRSVDPDALLRALDPSIPGSGGLARTPENITYAIRVLGAHGRFNDALALFTSMPEPPKAPAYAALLGACATQRNSAAAWEVWSSMIEAGVRPSQVALGCLMQACIRSHRVEDAFRAMKVGTEAGVVPSTVLFTHLIVGCVHSGQYERAFEVWHHMRTNHPEAAPDAVAYTALINACGKKDEVEKALGLLTEMRQLGVEPTHVTYNALIHAVGRSFRHADRAHGLFHEMVVAGHAHDVRSYEGVLLACSHSCDVTRARGYMHQMLGEGLKPTRVTLNILLAVYARGIGDLGRAKPDARDALLPRADGKELLAWEKPQEAAALQAKLKPTLGDYGRLVDGQDVDVLVENLLADYFNGEPVGRPAQADDDAIAEKSLEEDLDRYLPDVSETNQDMASPGFKEDAKALIAAGVLDQELLDELAAENEEYPALTPEEADRKGRSAARLDRKWRARSEAEALALAEEEVALEAQQAMQAQKGAQLAKRLGVSLDPSNPTSFPSSALLDKYEAGGYAAALEAGGGGGGAGAGALVTSSNAADDGDAVIASIQREALARLLSGRLLIDEVMDSTLQAAAAVTSGDGKQLAASSSKSSEGSELSASSLLKQAAATGQRVSFVEYLRRLEKEIDVAVFGRGAVAETPSAAGADGAVIDVSSPQPYPSADGLAVSGGDGNAPALASMPPGSALSVIPSLIDAVEADSDAAPENAVAVRDSVIGGKKLSQLLDIGDIPVPSTSDTEGDHDPVKLYNFYLSRVTERVEAALGDEYRAAVQGTIGASALAAEEAAEEEAHHTVDVAGPVIDAKFSTGGTRPALQEGTDWSDPNLSDNAPEYQRLALVDLAGSSRSGETASSATADTSVAAVPADDAAVDAAQNYETAAADDAVGVARGFGSMSVSRRQRKKALAQRAAASASAAKAVSPTASAVSTETRATASATTIAATRAEDVEVAGSSETALPSSAPSAATTSSSPAVVLEPVAPLDVLEPPAPGLVRRRRSGIPAVRDVTAMPRPASLAPVIEPPSEAGIAAAGTGSSVPDMHRFSAASALVAAFTPPQPKQPIISVAAQAMAAESSSAAATSPAASTAHAASQPAALSVAESTIETPSAKSETAAAASAPSPSAGAAADVEQAAASAWLAGVDQQLAAIDDEESLRRSIDAALLAAGAKKNAAGQFVFDGGLHSVPMPSTPEAKAALKRAAKVWDSRPAVSAAAVKARMQRGFAARVMARMLELERAKAGAVEAALVAATESVGKRRKRRVKGLQPGFVDTLLAVHKLKEAASAAADSSSGAAASESEAPLDRDSAVEEGQATASAATSATSSPPSDVTSPSSTSSASSAASAVASINPNAHRMLPTTPSVAAAEAAAQQGRQQAALAKLEKMTSVSKAKEGRLAALTSLSDKLVSGLHWLPAHDLPSERGTRKRVLLEEMRRIYYNEMPRMRMRPDAYTLNTVLTAYCAGGEDRAAYDFLQSEFPKHGVAPSVVSYRSLIRLHVLQRRTDRAEAVLATMRSTGVRPDRDCYGLLVHARAREWRIKDAIATVVEAREAGCPISEHWASLLRQRCKELNIRHPDVPAHPIAWQFAPRVLQARRAKGRDLNKQVALGLRHTLPGVGMKA